MHSRKLSGFDQEDLFLLQRLSRLDRLTPQKPEPAQIKSKQELCYYKMSLPEALAFYEVMGTALIRTREASDLGKYNSKDKSENEDKRSSQVMEVYQIQRYNDHNAKERMQEKQNEHKNKNSKNHEPVNPTNNHHSNLQNNALHNLDCSRGQDYLLYAYNQTGNLCIIGKDNQPGTYGGRITNGSFLSKA